MDIERHQDPGFIRATFASIAKRYDLANHSLSLGIDFIWRARAAHIVKRWRPQRVLDLATGSGDLAAAIRRSCPSARLIGADFCEPMLLESRRKGSWPLVVADGTQLPFRTGAFDVVTVAFGLRNMATREGALREMARVLRRDGHLLVMDFSLPRFAPLRSTYRAYLHHVLPKIAAALTGNRSAYEYLGESIERFPRDADMLDLMVRCGFSDCTARPLSFGIACIYVGRK